MHAPQAMEAFLLLGIIREPYCSWALYGSLTALGHYMGALLLLGTIREPYCSWALYGSLESFCPWEVRFSEGVLCAGQRSAGQESALQALPCVLHQPAVCAPPAYFTDAAKKHPIGLLISSSAAPGGLGNW